MHFPRELPDNYIFEDNNGLAEKQEAWENKDFLEIN